MEDASSTSFSWSVQGTRVRPKNYMETKKLILHQELTSEGIDYFLVGALIPNFFVPTRRTQEKSGSNTKTTSFSESAAST